MATVSKTERGFEIIEFTDSNGVACSLQQSSTIDMSIPRAEDVPGSSKLWLGRSGDRMHLSRDNVEMLASQLQIWLATGAFL